MTSARSKKAKHRTKESLRHLREAVRHLNLKRRYRFGRTISILIDENSVECATVGSFWHFSRLVDTARVYIPGSGKSEEKRRQFIIAEIKEYIKQFGKRSTRYVLGVGGTGSAFRIITLPKMPRKELAEAVYWEGTRRIPFGLDNSYHGHRLIANVNASTDDSISAALIAVMKDEIDRRLEYFDSLGIRVDAVHHELEAVGYLLPYIDDFSPDKSYALINIKKDSFEISFYRGMQLEFIHVSSIETETPIGSPGEPARSEYFTEALVNQIQNSLDYYIGLSSSTSTETVFVYGDLSYSEELIDDLSKSSGVEFKRFPLDRWAESRPHLRKYADQISVSLSAVALAMADSDMIDFLPPDVKESRAAVRYMRMAVPAFLVFMALLLGVWASLKYQVTVDSARLATTNGQIDRFKTSPTYTIYNQIKNQMAADRAVLEKLDQEPTFLHLNLKELSRLTPDNVKLDLYELQNTESGNSLILDGHAISSDPPPEIILAEFIARLESSPFYEKISLTRHTKRARGSTFVIDFHIEMEALI